MNAFETRHATGRLRWRCRDCCKDFTLTSGSPFAFAKMPAHKYLKAIQMLSDPNANIARAAGELDVQYVTAHSLAKRIRANADALQSWKPAPFPDEREWETWQEKAACLKRVVWSQARVAILMAARTAGLLSYQVADLVNGTPGPKIGATSAAGKLRNLGLIPNLVGSGARAGGPPVPEEPFKALVQAAIDAEPEYYKRKTWTAERMEIFKRYGSGEDSKLLAYEINKLPGVPVTPARIRLHATITGVLRPTGWRPVVVRGHRKALILPSDRAAYQRELAARLQARIDRREAAQHRRLNPVTPYVRTNFLAYWLQKNADDPFGALMKRVLTLVPSNLMAHDREEIAQDVALACLDTTADMSDLKELVQFAVTKHRRENNPFGIRSLDQQISDDDDRDGYSKYLPLEYSRLEF
jgi:hypothetical protein